jgi:hypothetical protein
MSGKVVPSAGAAPAVKPVAAHHDKRPTLAKTRAGVSRDARLVASGILEVLAGVRTPTETAKALGFSVPRYYLWEQRALAGLVRACEPRPVGKVASERHRIAVLEKEVARLRQEVVRQQALVRAAQRTIALAASAPVAKSNAKAGAKIDVKAVEKTGEGGKLKRKRRPVARALKAAATFREPIVDDAVESSTPTGHPRSGSEEVVQRSVPDSSLAAAESVPAAALSTV